MHYAPSPDIPFPITMATTVKYLYIDGGYLKRIYTDAARKWFGNDGQIDYQRVISTISHGTKPKKIFYYDCLDDALRQGESEADYKARQLQQEASFDAISEIDGCHVRRGTLSGRRGRRRQKEVDIRLAVDMMNDAIRGNMNHAVLLAGDLDFRPLVQSLVGMGIHVEIAAHSRSLSMPLRRAADSYHEIPFSDLYRMTVESVRNTRPLESLNWQTGPTEFKVLRSGTLAGGPVTLIEFNNGNATGMDLRQHPKLGNICTYKYGNDLEEVFQLEHGTITWDEPNRQQT